MHHHVISVVCVIPKLEKKEQDNIIVTKMLIPLFAGKLPLDRFDPNVTWWVMSAT